MDYYAGFSAYETVGSVVGFLIAILINSFSLRYATKCIASFKPSYWTALRGSILMLLASFATGHALGTVIEFMAIGSLHYAQPVGVALGIGIASYVLGLVLEHPDSGPIGFKKGLLTFFTAYVITALLLFSFVLVAFLLAHFFDWIGS